MSPDILLILIFLLFALGTSLMWRFGRSYGYFPGGALGLALFFLLVLVMAGR